MFNFKKLLFPKDKKISQLENKIKLAEFEKNTYLTLQKITATLVTDLDFERISQEIVNIMVKDLGYIGGILYLVNEKDKTVQGWTVSLTKIIVKKVLIELTKPVREYKSYINKQEHCIAKTAATGEIFISNSLKDFIYPTVPAKVCDLAQEIIGIKASISLPIIIKEKIIGVLMFTSNEKHFTEGEIKLLKTFTQQAGIAINNARMYRQIKTQVHELQEKTEDLSAVLHISEIAVSSLETKNITQKIVNSIPEKLGHLGFLGGILVMYDPKKGCVSTSAITESDLVQKKVMKILDRPFKDYYAFIDKDYTLTLEAIKSGKIQMGDSVEDFVSPPVNKSIAKALQKAVGIKSCAAVPILVHGQIIGAVVFCAKKVSKELGERDITLMTAFVNHIGVAIDNTILFKQTIKQVKELKKSKEKLEHALDLKSEFVSIVSHQLRTPLTVIKGYLSMIMEGFYGPMPEKTKKPIENVYISSERLIKLVNDFLNVSRVDSGKADLILEEVNLEEIISSTVDELKLEAEKKNLKLIWNAPKDPLPRITVDKEKMRQVILNLIDNSIKYTGKGFVAITAMYNAKKNIIHIEVNDSGEGIIANELPKIFKSFSRGGAGKKMYTGGSGLGLYICKRFVTMHHGKIWVESEGKDKGSTFYIELVVKKYTK